MRRTIGIAIVGVGNCANGLLQGIEYYRNAPEAQLSVGLMRDAVGLLVPTNSIRAETRISSVEPFIRGEVDR